MDLTHRLQAHTQDGKFSIYLGDIDSFHADQIFLMGSLYTRARRGHNTLMFDAPWVLDANGNRKCMHLGPPPVCRCPFLCACLRTFNELKCVPWYLSAVPWPCTCNAEAMFNRILPREIWGELKCTNCGKCISADSTERTWCRKCAEAKYCNKECEEKDLTHCEHCTVGLRCYLRRFWF